MPITKKYSIGGRAYTQRPLVLGQLARLLDELQGLVLVTAAPTAPALVAAFGNRMPRLLACVLVPEGQTPSQVDPLTESTHLGDHADLQTALTVVEDFLSCNPVVSLCDQLTGIINQVIGRKLGTVPVPGGCPQFPPPIETASKTSSACSPPATSAKEPKSSGE